MAEGACPFRIVLSIAVVVQLSKLSILRPIEFIIELTIGEPIDKTVDLIAGKAAHDPQ